MDPAPASNLGKTIATRLEAKQMTLTAFADAVGVSVSTAHGWKSGAHGIRSSLLSKVAEVLECPVAELV